MHVRAVERPRVVAHAGIELVPGRFRAGGVGQQDEVAVEVGAEVRRARERGVLRPDTCCFLVGQGPFEQHVEVKVDPPRIRVREGNRAVEKEAREIAAENPFEPGAQRISDHDDVVGEWREIAGRDRRHESRRYGDASGPSPGAGYAHLR